MTDKVKEYKYEGETFQIEVSSDYEIKVYDNVNTKLIRVDDGPPGYIITDIPDSGNASGMFTIEGALNEACKQLLEIKEKEIKKEAFNPDVYRKAMDQFIDNI